jgi:hypothetical protein
MAFLYALLYTIVPFSLGYYNLKELFGTKKGILITAIVSIISLIIPIYNFISFSVNLDLFFYIVATYWIGFTIHLLLNFKTGFVKIKRRLMYFFNLIFLGLYLNSMPIWNMSEIGSRLSPQSITDVSFSQLTNEKNNAILINKEHAINIAKNSLNKEIKKDEKTLKLNSVVEIDSFLVSLQKHKNSYYWIIPLKLSDNTLGYEQYNLGDIPAYIMVNATKEKTIAELVEHYSDLNGKKQSVRINLFTDGFYGRDLERTIKLENPTEIISSFSFNIDENKVPYAIAHVVEAGVGLGNYIPTKIIAYNLITNVSNDYSFSNTPKWVSSISDSKTMLDAISDWGLYKNSNIVDFLKGTHKVKLNNKSAQSMNDEIIMIPLTNGLGWIAEMTSTENKNQRISDLIIIDGLSMNVYLKTFNNENIVSSTIVEESIQGKLGINSGIWTTSDARPYTFNGNNVWIIPIISKKRW